MLSERISELNEENENLKEQVSALEEESQHLEECLQEARREAQQMQKEKANQEVREECCQSPSMSSKYLWDKENCLRLPLIMAPMTAKRD